MYQSSNFELKRCPHCAIANPLLTLVYTTVTANHANGGVRNWAIYNCRSCGGLITTAGRGKVPTNATEVYPVPREISDDIPERAREFLKQATESLHAPSGAIMLAASAVDAILKNRGYKKGTLNDRIDKAASDHLITKEMAEWAHEVRLEANDERHADEETVLPDEAEATKCIAFATALADFLFVLPARVERGRRATMLETNAPPTDALG